MVDSGAIETQVGGMGKNGKIAYATPKPFAGWKAGGLEFLVTLLFYTVSLPRL